MTILHNTTSPPLVDFASPVQGVQIIGYRIPYLPDFLADHTLLGERPSERIDEFLDRWVQFVGWLWKWRNSAFSLRLLSDPQAGLVQIVLLARLSTYPGEARNLTTGAEIAADLGRLMTTFGLPFQRLYQPELASCLVPFPNYALVEVRQHEENMAFPLLGKSGYVVFPYSGPAGSMLSPFETMLRQAAPSVVSLYLEPTDLNPGERVLLEEAAAKAETFKEHQLTGDYLPIEMNTMRIADPQVALAARIYTDFLKRLTEPFIVVAQMASPDPVTAASVARAFARAFIHDQSHEKGIGEPLPTATDVVAADAGAYPLARRAFEQLVYTPWGPSVAQNSPGMQRLRFLSDARGAAVAWRLPINVRGGVPGVEVRQPAPDFDPGPRPSKLASQEVQLGTLRRGGIIAASLSDFTRHCLVTGFTGSGKTNTVLYLLDQLWREQHIPFLVIEAAKKEYRSLVGQPGFTDLLVFTLGDETSAPFRLNPFEILPGVRLEAHLGRLQACFDAALPQFGILPSIVAEAMEQIYHQKGWKLTDRGAVQDERHFPTLGDMFRAVIRVAEQRGYAGETYHNIRAAAAGRIGSLLRGSRGRMFGAQRSLPAELIFSRPVVLELNDLNEDDKAMTMMFLLMWLREYRELNPANRLQHVTVVEEAHNVVSNVQSVGNVEVAADTRAKAVAAFANMLAEVRAYGEGIVISDQSPEKLAPDAMRNTNIQIAHQLRDQRDREAIARAMIMDTEQQNYLGKLRPGEAALFRSGMEKATFISVPNFKDTREKWQVPSDIEIHNYMLLIQEKYVTAMLPFDGCRFCSSRCRYRETIEPHTFDQELHELLLRALARFEGQPEPEYWPAHWVEVARVCGEAGRLAGHSGMLDAAYCYLAHGIDFPFTERMRSSFEIGFRDYLRGG